MVIWNNTMQRSKPIDGVVFQGEGLVFKKLTLDHSRRLAEWGVHENKLLSDYNLSLMGEEQVKVWFLLRKEDLFTKYFAVFTKEDQFIGYVGIKDINVLFKTALLGIVLDPNWVDMGYGKLIMRLFLDYYFNVLKMRILYLEVNEFNRRAIRLYEGLGFIHEGEHLEPFDVEVDLTGDLDYLRDRDCFVEVDGEIHTRIFHMKLDLHRYLGRPIK